MSKLFESFPLDKQKLLEDSGSESQCLHYLFELQVNRTPDRNAVLFEQRRITYQELNNRANQLAHFLQTLQVGPETLIGIYMDRSLDMVIGLLAILKAGAAYVPLDPTYPQDRLAFMMQDAQLEVLLTQQYQIEQLLLPQNIKAVCLDTGWDSIAQYSTANLTTEVTPDNLAYTIYTSGSTGRPKGVQISHRSIVNFLKSMAQTPGMVAQDIVLAVTTISFDIAALELYMPLMVGAQVVLAPQSITSDAAQLLKLLTDSGVTMMQATPATWRLLLAAGWQGNPFLKILCGGEAMPRDLANQLLQRSAEVWNMYGPTETTVWSTLHRVEPGDAGIPIGQAIANTQLYIVDPERGVVPELNPGSDTDAKPTQQEYLKPASLQTVAIGELGELLIGGMGVMRGYLNRPELNQEKLIPDPFSDAPAYLYRTGDLVRMLPDGTIEHCGRMDHQVKIRGFRIELGEVEAALYAYSAIQEVVVVAQENPSGDKRLVAYGVVDAKLRQELHLQFDLESSELQMFLRERLPEYMIPSTFVILDALPLTPNGKVDRQALPKPNYAQYSRNKEWVAPRNSTETQLAQIWAQILEIDHVGIHDNFFDLGGHSLLTAHLLCQVRDIFHIELPLLTLFESPTVATLAEAILQKQFSSSAIASPVRPTFGVTTARSTVEMAVLEADAVLDPGICPATPFINSDQEPQTIFLTGATGFLGVFLLQELLQQTQAKIYCLVRAATLDEGQQKIATALERHLLHRKGLESRIIPVLGDLTQPHFGLAAPMFRKYASEIDCIYHCGAFVNLIYPYPALRTANVMGTQEILKLASHLKIKPVHFISTLDVFQSPHYAKMPVILEQDPLTVGEGLSDGYAQSKWVAEKLVMEARSRGIPVCIYRPATITAHSQTGVLQTHDLIGRFIKGLVQLKSAPELDAHLNLTPVDYVSRAIIHLSRQPASIGKAFHLTTPHPLPFLQLVQELRNFGHSIQWTSFEQWQAQLIEATHTQANNALSPLLFLFTNWHADHSLNYLKTSALMSQSFDTQYTQTGLTETNIICQPLSPITLHQSFSFLFS
jgi:thioester reductase-like protein/amino acid adenylation domain-containing protein